MYSIGLTADGHQVGEAKNDSAQMHKVKYLVKTVIYKPKRDYSWSWYLTASGCFLCNAETGRDLKLGSFLSRAELSEEGSSGGTRRRSNSLRCRKPKAAVLRQNATASAPKVLSTTAVDEIRSAKALTTSARVSAHRAAEPASAWANSPRRSHAAHLSHNFTRAGPPCDGSTASQELRCHSTAHSRACDERSSARRRVFRRTSVRSELEKWAMRKASARETVTMRADWA